MIGRDLAGGDTASRFRDIDGRFKVMAHRQQFFYRIDHRDTMPTRLQKSRHNRDRHFFATANQRGVDAVRALTQQADTMQNMFDLSEFLFDNHFQPCKRESRLRAGKSCEQVRKNTFGIADIRQSILAADSFFNHRHQMVGNFRGGGKYGRYLPLPGIAFQNIGNTQKTFCICH